MNRIINNPDLVVEDMLRGYFRVHSDLVAPVENPRVVKRVAAPIAGKVGVITGGGSGHEPAFLGYVGENLVDAVAVGEIFSSPTAKSFFDAMKAANGGKGVACLYGNYAGDNMNVKMAIKMAEKEGIRVRTVVANDDVPSAPKTEREKRRGVAGEILMWKVGGAKAAMGGSLDEVIAVAQKAIDNTRSIGIGLSACTIPAAGKPNFHINDGEMEVGIGHHGEPGMKVMKTAGANEMADLMLETVLPDLPFEAGQEVAILLSGLGATPIMELYILYARVAEILAAKGIDIRFNFVGNLFTSLEMMGVTLTMMRLDEELKACLAYPCRSLGLGVKG
jgi:dihydroxyacetone kinase